jgi:hypothetical protein
MIHDLFYGQITCRNVLAGSVVVVAGIGQPLGIGFPIQAVVLKIVVLSHLA